MTKLERQAIKMVKVLSKVLNSKTDGLSAITAQYDFLIEGVKFAARHRVLTTSAAEDLIDNMERTRSMFGSPRKK